MPCSRFLFLLAASSLVLILFLPMVLGSNDLAPKIINCTTDDDCPANWTCAKDEISMRPTIHWPPNHIDPMTYQISINSSECVTVPTSEPILTLAKGKKSSFDGYVEKKVTWSRVDYPFHVTFYAVFVPHTMYKRVTPSYIVIKSRDNETEVSMTSSSLAGATDYSMYYAVGSDAGSSPTFGPFNFTTITTAPGIAENLEAAKDATSSTPKILTFQCPKNLGDKITEIIVRKRKVLYEVIMPYEYYNIPNEGICLNYINGDQLGDLEAGKTYSLEVKLKNVMYEGQYSRPVYITIKDENGSKKSLAIGLSVGILGCLVIAGCVIGFLCYRKKKNKQMSQMAL